MGVMTQKDKATARTNEVDQHIAERKQKWKDGEVLKEHLRREYKGKGFMPRELRPWPSPYQKGPGVCVRFRGHFGAKEMMWLNNLGFVVEDVWPEYRPQDITARFTSDASTALDIIVKCAGEKGELVEEAQAYPVVDKELFERWLRGYQKPKKAKKGRK